MQPTTGGRSVCRITSQTSGSPARVAVTVAIPNGTYDSIARAHLPANLT